MADYPIIFSAPMVRALLDGRKTMTRRQLYVKTKNVKTARVLTGHPPPLGKLGPDGFPVDVGPNQCWGLSDWQKVQPGDRLYVREGWKSHSLYVGMKPSEMPQSKVFYLADDAYEPSNVKGLPSIHMPRWASRLTLIVTATKIERLQEISEADAEAEGVELSGEIRGARFWHASHRAAFRALWSILHGPDAWDANPEVVALSFRVVRANIDSTEALAA